MADYSGLPYWFKVVDFLQQNWAVIVGTDCGAKAVFFSDTCRIFDELPFDPEVEASKGLRRNGFRLNDEDKEAQSFIAKPYGDFLVISHPNGPIYSSGRFWA